MTTTHEVLSAPCGTALDLDGMTMIVNHRHNVLDGVAFEVILTSDGRRYEGLWHDGPEADESVYVERWGLSGREFHGFIDPVTRRITQVG